VTLRLRLLLLLVGLVSVGLLVADAVTYASLRAFLVERIDQQLFNGRSAAVRALMQSGNGLGPSLPGVPPGETPNLPPGTWVAVIDASGRTLAATAFTYGGEAVAPPSLPTGLDKLVASDPGGATFTVGAKGSRLSYRVLAWAPQGAVTDQGTSYVALVAIPLSDLAQTLARLLWVELFVTAGVIAGLAALAWWMVRRELRPLDDMAVIAGAIAAGDLTQRVEPAEPRTEVGRLGLALNAMLSQIEQAFARRKASEDALRRFLAQASHELRTPLASIRGYAELFRRGAKDRPEDLELAMRRIEQEGARMGVLVEELLLLARLDEGRPLKRESVDLAQVAADAAADAHIAAPDRVIDLDARDTVVLQGDELRLRQVAANLVTNALIHAGPSARVAITARSNDGWAELEVSDDGIGMTPDVAAHVFEPFYHAERTAMAPVDGGVPDEVHTGATEVSARPLETVAGRNAAPSGEAEVAETTTGLGLAIALGIAEAHGGHIELRTAPHCGSTFIVRLPVRAPGGPPAGQTSGGADKDETGVEPPPVEDRFTAAPSADS
jgi:two-component system OmpR family sensor kinase